MELIHGAKWWKFDFHNHTPASEDFGKGDAAHKGITPRNWLLMYMNAEIDCVAITDHNSGEWVDKLKTEYEIMVTEKPEGFRTLYLFPGVEITANNNVHILAVFNCTATTSAVSSLLGAVEFPFDKYGTSEAVTRKSLENVIEEIHKAGAIAIPAHVDKSSGLFTVNTGNTLKQILDVEGLLAIELIDKSYAKPAIYNQSKLHLAEVVGTDSHIAAQVGSNYTWVKMNEPSLDALKLALHDREDGVKRMEDVTINPNLITNRYFIKSLKITKGFKAGNSTPLITEFSPWLTSVIGGRGSGKSTIINYLRIALARTDDMPKDIQEDFNKFNQIGNRDGAGMLRNDTTIEVEIYKDGKLHLIKYENGIHTLFEWDESTTDWGLFTVVSNVKELFPIQIFNQKELYALTSNPSKLIELIDSQFDKSSWWEAKEKLINKWLATRAKRRELKNAISEEANIKAQLSAVTNKISLFESSSYKDTLDSFNKLSEANSFFSNTNEKVSLFISQLETLETSVPKIEIPEKLSEIIVDDSLQFLLLLKEVLGTIKSKINESIELVKPYKENLSQQLNSLSWYSKFEDAKNEYAAIAESIKELSTETYETLIQKKSILEGKLDLIEIHRKELETLTSEMQLLFESIIEKEKELRIKRKEIIDRWEQIDNTSNPFLIIELDPMADIENAVSTFRQLLRRNDTAFGDDIYGSNADKSWGVVSRIVNAPLATRWENRNIELKEFLSASEADKKNIDMRLAKHIDGLRLNTPEDIDRLLVWVPEDKLILKFRKQGAIQDIQTGSAGERTAGMLGLLIALNNIPLIIDQPEDDLDTKLISNFVVEGFKKVKQERQLLIVTHNPNITVNANSDNVVHMEFAAGQVIKVGNNALQDVNIRKGVCEVMEGGRDALNKRYYRISKALKN